MTGKVSCVPDVVQLLLADLAVDPLPLLVLLQKLVLTVM